MSTAEIAGKLRLARSTVAGHLTAAGFGRLARLEPAAPARRYQRQHPGELVHLDVKKLARFERTGHRITGNRRNASEGAGPPGSPDPGPFGIGSAVLLAADGSSSTSPSMTPRAWLMSKS
jgi:hypothetical protein